MNDVREACESGDHLVRGRRELSRDGLAIARNVGVLHDYHVEKPALRLVIVVVK